MPRPLRSAVVSRTETAVYHLSTRVTRGLHLFSEEDCPWTRFEDLGDRASAQPDGEPMTLGAGVDPAEAFADAPPTMKAFFLERLAVLQRAFPVLIYGYAVMDNHLHLLLHWDPSVIDRLTKREAVSRWVNLYWRPQAADGPRGGHRAAHRRAAGGPCGGG